MNGLLQQRHAVRAEERTQAERLRQDRLTAYLEFAQSVGAFRAAQMERWNARHDHTADSDECRRAREETHRTGGTVRVALFRVQLLIDEKELSGLAHEALSLAFSVEKADNEDDLNRRVNLCREKTEEFILAAGRLGQVR